MGEGNRASLRGLRSRSSSDGSYHTAHLRDVDVTNATFTARCLAIFSERNNLGLVVTRQDVRRREAVLERRRAEADPWRRTCSAEARVRDTAPRRLGHPPFGDRPKGTVEVAFGDINPF